MPGIVRTGISIRWPLESNQKLRIRLESNDLGLYPNSHVLQFSINENGDRFRSVYFQVVVISLERVTGVVSISL
jgi:hypothetical protein